MYAGRPALSDACAGRMKQSRQVAVHQHVGHPEPAATGRCHLPPPPSRHRPSGGESGRERPPSLARDLVFPPFPGGRSRPDSEYRPFVHLCSCASRRACTVHDALASCVRRQPYVASRRVHGPPPPTPSSLKDQAMSVIKPGTRGKQLVPHRTRLDHETNETLYA